MTQQKGIKRRNFSVPALLIALMALVAFEHGSHRAR